jgi:hypothetical protein
MGQPKVEIVDEHAIKYSWDKPNPYIIESQARAESDLQSRHLSMRH